MPEHNERNRIKQRKEGGKTVSRFASNRKNYCKKERKKNGEWRKTEKKERKKEKKERWTGQRDKRTEKNWKK